MTKEKQKFREQNPHYGMLEYLTKKISMPFRNFVYPPDEPTTLAKNKMNCWLKGKIHIYQSQTATTSKCVYCGRAKSTAPEVI